MLLLAAPGVLLVIGLRRQRVIVLMSNWLRWSAWDHGVRPWAAFLASGRDLHQRGRPCDHWHATDLGADFAVQKADAPVEGPVNNLR